MDNKSQQIKNEGLQEQNLTKNGRANPKPGVGSPETPLDSNRTRPRQLLHGLSRIWAWLFLILLIIGFSFSPGFLTLGNFQAVLANNALFITLALGQMFTIITGGIDLSTGFVMGLSSVTASLVMRSLPPETNLLLVILIGIASSVLVGMLSGLINGTVISHLKVPPFIATLGMYGIARGVAYILSGGPPVSVNKPGLGQFGNGHVIYYHPDAGLNLFNVPESITGPALREVTAILPYQVIYVVIFLLAINFILSKTRFGHHVYAIGGSELAALRAGINVNFNLMKVYVLCSIMTALAGFLYVLRYSGGVAAAGDALMLNSVAAIVIGGASLMGGEGKVVGTLVGCLIIAILQNGLIIMGIDPFWQYVAVGVILILAVLMDQAKDRVVS